MSATKTALPPVVSREEWLAARKTFLAKEKAFTRQRDALNAERRRLPMVKIDKDYVFQGPEGQVKLVDLFKGHRQLIVYHFMFDPDDAPAGKEGAPYDEGCPGCSFFADNVPHLSHLNARDTRFVLVSRARLAKIEPFKKRMGWTIPWYSSFDSDFNYDFHVTLDETRESTEWNYQDMQSLVAAGKIPEAKGELPGLSVFLRDGDDVYHTYSTYARGLDIFINVNNLLDMTPYGRQEEWEDSPEGWPKTSMWWLRHHDKYDDEPKASESCCHTGDGAA